MGDDLGILTDSERITQLEKMVLILALALYRQGTERDGNWGHPSAREEFKRVCDTLQAEIEQKL